jgi:ribonuclease PH
MSKMGMLARPVIRDHVAAVSCGIRQGQVLLDLDYEEDSGADTDANFVLTGAGGLVEVQATAEAAPFTDLELGELLRLARKGVTDLIELQKRALA